MNHSVQPETDRQRRFDELFAAYSPDIPRTVAGGPGPPSIHRTVWLYATARRVIANHRRSSRRRAALAERLARETPRTAEPNGEESLVTAYEELHTHERPRPAEFRLEGGA